MKPINYFRKVTPMLIFLTSMLGAANVYADNYLTTTTGSNGIAAVGDGKTDDTAALQAALNHCHDANVICEIPAGKTHYVTGPLFLWGNTSLVSSAHGGISFNVLSTVTPYLINLGVQNYYSSATPSSNPDFYTGTISGVEFTMLAGGTDQTTGGGRILWFWHTNGATISNNYFNVGPYAYGAIGSGNNANYVRGSQLNRTNVSILNNTVVSTGSGGNGAGSEGIGLELFDTALIQGNTVTGVVDDAIGLHWCKNVKVLSNTLRSTHGRIYIGTSQNIEVGNNKHIRIASRGNGVYYAGIALIEAEIENPGTATDGYSYPPDGINIHDNALYLPKGSVDNGYAINLFGARHTKVINNIIINDADTPAKGAVNVASQSFFAYDENGNLIIDSNGNPAKNIVTWVDPTQNDSTYAATYPNYIYDTGFYNGGYSAARTHEVTLTGNISSTTQTAGDALSFGMSGWCDSQVGPITLINNSTPAFINFFDVYSTACGNFGLFITDLANPNIITAKPTHPLTGTLKDALTDTDGDGYPDLFDNCPNIANPDQADADGNGIGDMCQAIPQTITITKAAPATAVYKSSFNVAATASSGLSVAITVTGGCSFSGNTVTMTSNSTDCVVSYDQVGNSNYAAAPHLSNTTKPTAQGLTGVYFNNKTETNPSVLTRTDANINFNWGSGSPATGINKDNFSVRWSGKVLPPVTGNYTFCSTTDDGVKLSINGNLVISKWTGQFGATRYCSAVIALTQNVPVSIQMDYFEGTLNASAVLKWSYPNQAEVVIPTTQLYAQ